MRRRLRSVVTVLAGVLALLTTAPVTGQAEPVGALAWQEVRVTINRASLFQCPSANCNQGEASTSHVVQLYCKLSDTSPMMLVHNQTNGHVGWIDFQWLIQPTGERPTVPPNCLGSGIGTHVVRATALYQCPATNCNQGQADPSHDIAVLCQIPSYGWRFVVNQSNKHVGFVQSLHLTYDPNVAVC